MKFLSLEPFIPSGSDFEKAKLFFVELGFVVNWEIENYTGFQKDECRFILQQFDQKEFAENLMVNVNVDNVSEFRDMVIEKKLSEKFGIRIGDVTEQPYGKEVNIIDIAGVCWHFVEE